MKYSLSKFDRFLIFFPQPISDITRHFVNTAMHNDLRQFEIFLTPEFLTCGRCCKLLPRSALGSHLLFCCDQTVPNRDLLFNDFDGPSISSMFKLPSEYKVADPKFTRVLVSILFASFLNEFFSFLSLT